MNGRIGVAIETGAKKVFATAVDWPGWSRSAKTEALALEALAAAADRYADVVALSGSDAFLTSSITDLEVVERNLGGAGTDFGVPSLVTSHDRRPTSQAEADRLRRLVAAAWTVFDRVIASAPRNCARVRVAAVGTATRSSIMSWNPITPTARSWGSASRPPRAPIRARSRRCGRRSSISSAKPRTVRRSAAGSGRLAMRPTGSPGTRSITPGKSRIAVNRECRWRRALATGGR